MRQKYFLFCILCAIMVCFTTGCMSWSGRYETSRGLHEPHPFPFKFQINTIKMYDDLDAAEADTDKEMISGLEDLRLNLIKKYPQYFTDSKHNSLAVDIELTHLPPKMKTPEWKIFLAALASGFSYGLVPVFSHVDHNWKISIRSEFFKVESNLRLSCKVSFSIILGTILQTHRLIPYMDNYHISSGDDEIPARAVMAPDVMAVKNVDLLKPSSEHLLKFFPDALKDIDRDAVIRKYNAKFGPESGFLE